MYIIIIIILFVIITSDKTKIRNSGQDDGSSKSEPNLYCQKANSPKQQVKYNETFVNKNQKHMYIILNLIR